MGLYMHIRSLCSLHMGRHCDAKSHTAQVRRRQKQLRRSRCPDNLIRKMPGLNRAFFLYYLLSERHESQKGHLEMLDAERDSDDRYAAEQTEGKMKHRDLYSSHADPYHIHYY